MKGYKQTYAKILKLKYRVRNKIIDVNIKISIVNDKSEIFQHLRKLSLAFLRQDCS